MTRPLCLLSALLVAACSNDPDIKTGNGDTGVEDPDDVGGQTDMPAEDASTEPDSGTPADMGTADMGSERPLIHEADLCEVPDNPRATVAPGTELMKVTLDAPDALCNDGSPAIVYVRPAPANSENADRWFIWLEGGGSCNNATGCVDRWCGANPLFTAAKMSSRYAPEGVRGTGIFGSRPENDFSNWNQVMGYYCSSDNWSGRKKSVAIDESGDSPEFELYLHGAYIVDAMVETLKAGATSDDGSMTLPSVDDAAMVVFSGTSAGGGGARYNADRVGDMLRETNADVDYRLVVDAGTYPNEPNPPELTEEDALALLDLKHDTLTNWRNAVTDASCLEYHADDPRWCADNSHLVYHHITTPWFVKMDLSDNANSPGPYADGQTFSRVTYDLYASMIANTFVPEEADVPIDTAGLFIPNCGHHVNLEVSDFYGIEITNGMQAVSNHDVLSNWIERTQPTQALHDPNAGFTSVCP